MHIYLEILALHVPLITIGVFNCLYDAATDNGKWKVPLTYATDIFTECLPLTPADGQNATTWRNHISTIEIA